MVKYKLGRIGIQPNDTSIFYLFYLKRYSYPQATARDEIGDFMVNNSKAFKLARYAIMLATIVVAMALDRQIGLALTAGFSQQLSTAALVILVTFTFCFLDDTWLTAILSWTFFGFASFIKEFIPGMSSSVANLPIYMWPVVTMLPRIASGVVAFCTYKLMLLATRKIGNERKRQVLSMMVAIFLGNAANTILFLSTLNLFKQVFSLQYSAMFELIKLAALTNILPEYTISIALAPFIVLGVRRGLKLGIDGDNWKRINAEENSETQQPSESKNDTASDN